MTKKFFAIIISVFMLLTINFSVFAAKKPYCHQYSDSNIGADILQYYSYNTNKKSYAEVKNKRLYIYESGKLLLGDTAKKKLTNSLANIKHPVAWYGSSNIIWIDRDSNVQQVNISNTKNITQLATNAYSLYLDSDRMVTKVTFKNGVQKTIAQLIVGNTSGTTGEGPGLDDTSKNPPSSTILNETIDTAGRKVITFNGNKILQDGTKVFFNNFLVSTMCDSFVKYFAVQSNKKYFYLLEDSTNSYYRFSVDNIFMPKKMKLTKDTEKIKQILRNDDGYMIGIETASGVFTPSQFAFVGDWYPNVTYAMNKFDSGYIQCYIAGTKKVHKLIRKYNNLYLNSKKVITGITKTSKSYGFNSQYIFCIKNSKAYRALISNPTKWKVWKKNVNYLTYGDYGLVKGAKK